VADFFDDNEGPIHGSFVKLKELLSQTEAWQRWTGTYDEQDEAASIAGAAESIYLIDLPAPAGTGTDGDPAYTADELSALRPFLVVDHPPPEAGPDDVFVSPRHAQAFFVHHGRLNIALEADEPASLAGDFAASKAWFQRRLDRLIEGIQLLGDTDDRLAVTEIRLWNGPVRSDAFENATKGRFWAADLLIQWGVDPR
jgi:hypothetical protein